MAEKRTDFSEKYIDKTKLLEKGIMTFPSIFIEGAAASGKSTAVKMLVQKHQAETVTFYMKDMQKEDEVLFAKQLCEIKERMKKENLWLICEEIESSMPERITELLADFIRHLQGENKCILISREKPNIKFLDLLWKEKMTLIGQKALAFTNAEVEKLCHLEKVSVNAKELNQETGGWAGCVRVMLRMAAENTYIEKAQTVKELRNCYEVDEYIQKELLGSLTDPEKKILSIGSWSPWINKKMFQDIQWISDSAGLIDNLERQGFLIEIEGERYQTAPLFREGNQEKPSPAVWKIFGQWYASEGHVKEAVWCAKSCGDEELLQMVILQNYAEVPFVENDISYVKEWKGNIPELLYLRGVACYLSQDLTGLDKEIRSMEKILKSENNDKNFEIYINLLYLKPNLLLVDWLESLDRRDGLGKKLRLYNVLGGSDRYLCGLRDLSDMFIEPRREENRKLRIWKDNLDEQAWEWIRLARQEYYVEIGQEKASEQEEDVVLHWIQEMEEEKSTDITEWNYRILCRYGKACLKMRQFDRADKIFGRLVPYLRVYQRNRFLAEILFEQAVCTWEKGSHGQALRYVIESFIYNGDARYTRFYTEYGTAGKEVLNSYIDWMKQNSSEGWHRKKKYNYGNAKRMPMEDYLEMIYRAAKKKSTSRKEIVSKAPEERLTVMETVILTAIGKGKTNAEICEEQNLKLSTVKSHIYSLYRKLGVKNRMQATIKGKEMGILK